VSRRAGSDEKEEKEQGIAKRNKSVL